MVNMTTNNDPCEPTQLEWECNECAEYILQRVDDGNELTQENLAMWIHDHFNGPEDR